MNKTLQSPLPKHRLPVRVRNIIADINTYGDLATNDARELLCRRGLGATSLQLLRLMLVEKGLHFADECLPDERLDWSSGKVPDYMPDRIAATIACMKITLGSLRRLKSSIDVRANTK